MRRTLGKSWSFVWILAWLIAALFAISKGEASERHRAVPLKVVVIDTGINIHDKRFNVCGYKDMTGHGMEDATEVHATHVAGIVTAMVEGSKDVCLVPCRFYTDTSPGIENLKRETACFNWAVEQHADFINYSGGGGEFNEDEYLAVRHARAEGITVVVAAGNERSDMDKPENYYYPASYRILGVSVVASIEPRGFRALSSNWGAKTVTIYAPGDSIYSTLPVGEYGYLSGTSMATAVQTGNLIRQRLGLTALPFNQSLWKHLRTYWDSKRR